MRLEFGTQVIVDGQHYGRIVDCHGAGRHTVEVFAPELYQVVATWDGDARSAHGNCPLLVNVETDE